MRMDLFLRLYPYYICGCVLLEALAVPIAIGEIRAKLNYAEVALGIVYIF